jgi:hypothetical protein
MSVLGDCVSAKRKLTGRPPTGKGGVLVSRDYRRLTIRVHPDDLRLGKALAAALRLTDGELAARAWQALRDTLPADLRRAVQTIAKDGGRI